MDDELMREIDESKERVAMMQRSVAAGGRLTEEGKMDFINDLKFVYASLQRARDRLGCGWLPVDEFTWKHKDDDGLYALIYSIDLDSHCAALWLGDNNWQCLEGGELIEWCPTHAHLLETLTPPPSGKDG